MPPGIPEGRGLYQSEAALRVIVADLAALIGAADGDGARGWDPLGLNGGRCGEPLMEAADGAAAGWSAAGSATRG